jgi:hypothetical protein
LVVWQIGWAQVSPDGKYIVWERLERDGSEADKNRLFVSDMETGN